MVPYSSDGDVTRDIQPASGCKKPLLPHSLTHTNTRILSPATLDTAQGTESLSHLRKLAQNFPTQESVGLAGMVAMGGGMGAIDEDDDVPGQSIHRLYFFIHTRTHFHHRSRGEFRRGFKSRELKRKVSTGSDCVCVNLQHHMFGSTSEHRIA